MARGLSCFAHKIKKNRRLGDFLPRKLRKEPDNRGFCGTKRHKNPQAQQAPRKLFAIMFLLWASACRPLSYAQDTSAPPAGEQNDATETPDNSGATVQPEPARQVVQPEPVNTSLESAEGEDTNQSGNTVPESGQPFPFSGSFENGKFGTVTITGRAVISDDAGERTLEITEGTWESEFFSGQITKLKKTMLISVVVFIAFAIAGLALGILGFVFGVKKKKLAELNANIRDIEKDYAERYNVLKDGLEAARQGRSEYSVSPADVHGIETRVDTLEQNLRNFANVKDLDALSRRIGVLEDDKKTREDIKKGALDPLEVFNSWTANPAVPLPEAFYYLQGDFRIRVTHTLKESAGPSKWISNRYGNTKYLLPNPNFFDPMTNISELYVMDMTRLKTKGQNRVRVILPCEMADNGYVNYPGELQLL
jgi:hypothetical protein